MQINFKWTWRLLIVGAGLAIISVAAAGAGHGTMELLRWFFPWAYLSELSDGTFDYDVWAMAVLILQFPLYGFLTDIFRSKWVLAVLLLIHVILVMLLLEGVPIFMH